MKCIVAVGQCGRTKWVNLLADSAHVIALRVLLGCALLRCRRIQASDRTLAVGVCLVAAHPRQ